MRIQNITDMIGNTPLVRVNDKVKYYAKIEGSNLYVSNVAEVRSEASVTEICSENCRKSIRYAFNVFLSKHFCVLQ